MLTPTSRVPDAPPGIETGAPTVIQSESTTHVLVVRDEVELEINGRLIGYASSRRDDHTHSLVSDTITSADGESTQVIRYVHPGERCSACRWFEVRIFLVECEYADDCTCDAADDDVNGAHRDDCGEIPARGKYLVLTYGLTIVPGETHKRRAAWTSSPYEIIEILTQRNGGKAFLPATSAQVIAQAAACDHGIETAYVNRAVV